MRQDPILPEGYRIERAGVVLRLHGPQGLLQEARRGPTAADDLADRAWQEAWREIERELADDIRALREGTRSLHELKRLRQYFRMLDAIERPPIDVQGHGRRSRVVAGLAIAASAAAMAATLLATQLWRAPGPGPGPQATRPPIAGPGMANRPGRQSVPPAASKSTGRRAPARAVQAYVVSFGEFAGRAAADVRMHLIRSKGYVVYIMHAGNAYHVVTGPRAQAHAERLAGALQEIGLPARAQHIGAARM
jgi:hypothetical protein